MKIRRSARPLCLATSLFLPGAWMNPAPAQLLGPEFQVNTYTTEGQFYPAVAGDGLGNFVVVWDSSGQQDGSGLGVFGQRFNSAGDPLGNEFQVNTYTTDIQWRSAVAADNLGNFVVVWDSSGQDGSGRGVFGQRFNSAGDPLGNEFPVNTYTTGFQSEPAVAADGLGNFVVVWGGYEQDGSSGGVFGQRFNSAGSPAGSEFQVNSYTTSLQSEPAVAADGLGNFLVVWESSDQDGSLHGVFGQRFNSAGDPLGNEFQVNTYTTNHQLGPAVAADGLGNFVVVWGGYEQDGSSGGVFGQQFNSVGAPVGSEFRINTFTTGDQDSPSVAADSLGNFLVAWRDQAQDGSSHGVFGKRFNSVGGPLGNEFQVNSYTTSFQMFPAVAADSLGNFVVAWTSSGQDGGAYGVFGQRLAAALFADGFEFGDACAWSVAVGGGC